MKLAIRLLLPLLAASVVVGCGSPDQKAIWTAEKNVAARMKDPDSAKFSAQFLIRSPVDKNGFQQIAVCGVVDGKNSFGALTGGTRFVVLQSEGRNTFTTESVQIEDADRRATVDSVDKPQKETIFESIHWNRYCVDAAHPPMYSGESWH